MAVSSMERVTHFQENGISWTHKIDLSKLQEGSKLVVFLMPGSQGEEKEHMVRVEMVRKGGGLEINANSKDFSGILRRETSIPGTNPVSKNFNECYRKWNLGKNVGLTSGIIPLKWIGTEVKSRDLSQQTLFFQNQVIVSGSPEFGGVNCDLRVPYTELPVLRKKINLKVIFGDDEYSAQILNAGILRGNNQDFVLPKAA